MNPTSTLRAAVAILTIAVLAWHCGGSGHQGTTITVMHWGGFMEQDWRDKVIAPFERAHPDIHVELAIVPYGLYAQRLLASAAGGAAPGDVLMVDDWLAAELMARGYARDVDDRAAKDLALANFFPDILREWRAFGGGRMRGLPFSAGTTVLFYNKDLFERAHLAYPDSSWTYDDCFRAAARLTTHNADGTTTWGLLVDDGGFSGLDSYIHAMGGRLLSDDGRRACDTEAATRAAIARWVGLVTTDHVAPQPSAAAEQWGQLFGSGHAAMAIVGDHFPHQFAGSPVRWGVAPPPRGTAGRWSRRFDDGFVIPEAAQHPDAAWEFVRWVVTYPPQEGVCRIMEKSTPAWQPLAASAAWQHETGADRAALLSSLFHSCTFTEMHARWNEWRDNIFVPEIDNAFLGRTSVDQALADAAAATDKVLQRP